MISIELMGGLGNQIFQIASTFAHAKDNNLDCGFDLRHTDLPLQGRKAIEYEKNLYSNLPKIKWEDYKFSRYREPRWEYSPIPLIDNVLLFGYFQSPKHFNHRKEEILNLFLGNDVIRETQNTLRSKYSAELQDSISVHVRRGDYLKLKNFHPIPSVEYYKNAIQSIMSLRNVNHILVFSDDITWCKQNLANPVTIFIESQQDYEDLLLMGLCTHNVLSNSSFSWWGSYFNTNPDKIVYVPARWCGAAAKHTWEDIYLPEMKLL